MERPRRRVGADRAQLHLGHHRQSQGCGLSSPRRVSERARQCDHLRARSPLGLPVDPADVPLQRLDLPLGGDRGWRDACLPAPSRTGGNLCRDRRAPGHPPMRRADRAEYVGARARSGEAPLRPRRRGGDRGCGAAFGRHRGDGADGVPRHPSLRVDRELRSVGGMRLGSPNGPGCRWPSEPR